MTASRGIANESAGLEAPEMQKHVVQEDFLASSGLNPSVVVVIFREFEVGITTHGEGSLIIPGILSGLGDLASEFVFPGACNPWVDGNVIQWLVLGICPDMNFLG
jgi:hypothetical protein